MDAHRTLRVVLFVVLVLVMHGGPRTLGKILVADGVVALFGAIITSVTLIFTVT